MSDKNGGFDFTRRQTLAWAGATAAALGVGGVLMRQYHGGAEPAAGPYDGVYDDGVAPTEGYGRDPDLTNPRRDLWPRTVSAPHLSVIEALADVILPGDGERPAPSSLGLGDFFSEWLSAPYPEQRADRALLLPFIDALSEEGFAAADGASQTTKAETLHAAGADEPAFQRFLRLTAGAYYTTPEGAAIMGFIGNQPSNHFAGPPDDVIAHLEREAAKLTPYNK